MPATLRERVEGWPAAPSEEDVTLPVCLEAVPDDSTEIDGRRIDSLHNTDDDDTIDMLVREGLLTTNSAFGKNPAPPRLETPTITFLAAPRLWPVLNKQHAMNFVSSWALRHSCCEPIPLSWIVHRARRRKDRETQNAPPLDLIKARQLTTVHLALQPVFYDAKDACLRNSLTLVEFLSRYRIYPTWVFGVKMNPFAAHSWVQLGSSLLTDPIADVKTYTPIMSV
ncbi:MAG: lasso peptide biosynthesis B2 protein [Gammaproteobacteria bacterium]